MKMPQAKQMFTLLLMGIVLLMLAMTFNYRPRARLVPLSIGIPTLLLYMLASFVAGIVLSIVAAIYPANVASNMIPANALRSNI